MAARVRRFQCKALVDLLTRLDSVEDVHAALHAATTTFVQRILCVDQLAVILKEPCHAIVRASFFVGGQCDDDVAIRYVTFLA